jgi:hypothetical protein
MNLKYSIMKSNKQTLMRLKLFVFVAAIFGQSCMTEQVSSSDVLYDLGTQIESRSISYENTNGETGSGGQAASYLGIGRKGAPAVNIKPGQQFTLCDISGPGTIRHIWMTGGFKDDPKLLRQLTIRAYWEDQDHASIECPLGDFMGAAHGKVNSYQSAVHSTGINAAFNFWLPMPFTKQARIILTNESDKRVTVFYQVDYTLNDEHPENLGRLHVCFRRQNPTVITNDFEILPQRKGKGRYLGAVLGIRTINDNNWWGEGEIKIYMDGDQEFPTICGTGSEDYICLSYGMQQTPFQYHGCSWNQNGYISMYRWHLPDPIFWKDSCRITIQQMGWSYEKYLENEKPLYERSDDWSSATFWYEPIPSDPLPTMPGLQERTVALWQEGETE